MLSNNKNTLEETLVFIIEIKNQSESNSITFWKRQILRTVQKSVFPRDWSGRGINRQSEEDFLGNENTLMLQWWIHLTMYACILSRFSCVWQFVTQWTTPGSSVHGILQARILEWVSWPPPGDLPNPGMECLYILHWQVGSLPLVPQVKPQMLYIFQNS